MKHFTILGLITTILISVNCESDDLVRNTKYGKIRGQLVQSADNNLTSFYSFKSIPYARPPIGKYRFKPPVAPIQWHGIIQTTVPAQRCVQIKDNFNGEGVVGTEDCLYLEVFEPKTARERYNLYIPLPVMLWIHGGTFIFGAANSTGPDYFMEKPVIIVTIQYRVNVFGFLSTEDRYATGNFGLKDQLFALKWVKQNIEYFGGDPNKVTIFGESAGGASVLYHIISRQSRGYFHRAISQSGSSLNRWAFQSNPREMAFRLGKHFGIETNNSKELTERLQEINYRDLELAAFNKSVVGFYTPYYAQPFAPSLEAESDEAFLTKRMFESLENREYTKVPFISGYNTEEGSFAYDYILNGRANLSIYNKQPELLIPISMNIDSDSGCGKQAICKIQEFYFQDTNVFDGKSWTQLMSQELFVRGIIKTMELIYESLPMYFYKFSYTGGHPTSHFGGVGHYQEIQFLWYARGVNDTPISSEADKLISKRLITLWTNFANTSNPTPMNDEVLQNVIWPMVDHTKPYLVIDDNLTISHNPNKENSDFWEQLFRICGNPPYRTY